MNELRFSAVGTKALECTTAELFNFFNGLEKNVQECLSKTCLVNLEGFCLILLTSLTLILKKKLIECWSCYEHKSQSRLLLDKNIHAMRLRNAKDSDGFRQPVLAR